jgi:hypothetical protein
VIVKSIALSLSASKLSSCQQPSSPHFKFFTISQNPAPKTQKNLNFETRTSIISENLGVLEEICEKESKGCRMDLTSEGKRTRSQGIEQERETKGDSKGDSKGCCSDCLNNKEKINLSC